MYLMVRRACAIAAVVAGAVYFTALLAAEADGPDGVTMPNELSRVIMTAVSVLVVISLGGWIIEQAIESNIERNTRRVCAEEVDRVRNELVAEIQRSAGHSTGEIQQAVIRAASAARSAAVAEVRDALDEGVRQIIESGLKRAEVRGMIKEATSRASHVTGTNGATVHALRPGEEA